MRVSIVTESKIWEKLGRDMQKMSPRFVKSLLGNAARQTHAFTAYRYMHLGPAISGLTKTLRRADGITSNRAGDATGRLARAVGTPDKGNLAVVNVGYNRGSIRWRRDGFSFGDKYPRYTKYLESGFSQTITPKQAAYLTHKIMQAEMAKSKVTKKNIDKKIKGARKPAKQAALKRAKKYMDTGFNYGLFKSLIGKRLNAPDRPFNYLSSDEIRRVQMTAQNTLTMIVDQYAHKLKGNTK